MNKLIHIYFSNILLIYRLNINLLAKIYKMKSSHTNSVQKIKNMSFASFKTLSNSPKVNQMYESLKYFAPIVHTNEKQMIDEIRSMGKQILQAERDVQIPKKKMEPVIEQKLNQSIDKLNIESNLNKTFYQNPKFGIDESFMNRSLTQSRQKSFLSQRQKWEQMKKSINGRYSSRNHVTTPQNNLYDKYKFQVKMSKFKNFQSKTQNLKEDLKYIKNDKPNQQQKRQQQQKFAKKQQLNYTKFVDKNIKKIVKEQKEINQKTNQKEKQKFINVFDPKLKQYVKKPVKTHATKVQIQRSVQKINNKILENQSKKHQKISKLRQEQIKKQMQNVTFKPKLQTTNYNSKIQSLKSKPSLQNFESRLTIDVHIRKSHQKEIIKQILQKSPFNPRINPPSPHITSQSKIKSIWSSNYISLNSNLSISTQNLKKSSLLTDDKSIGQKSIPTTGISIKASPQQLNFLFN